MEQRLAGGDDGHPQDFVDVRNPLGATKKCRFVESEHLVADDSYLWTPPGLNADQVSGINATVSLRETTIRWLGGSNSLSLSILPQIEAYFSEIPRDKVPKLGWPGQEYRAHQLAVQLPRQDLALAHCRFVDKDFEALFQDFVDTRNICALDIGQARVANANHFVSLLRIISFHFNCRP